MDMHQFIDQLLAAALKAGISAAEVYYASADSFQALCVKDEITSYSVSTSGGLSLRGLYHDKMGYASTEAFDDAAISQLVSGVIESAQLVETAEPEEIFAGSPHYETLENYSPALDQVSENKKLDFLRDMEKCTHDKDPRITQVAEAVISTDSYSKLIRNTYGLSLSYKDNDAAAYLSVTGRDKDQVACETAVKLTHDFGAFNAAALADESIEKTLFMLGAQPVACGTYRAILHSDAMMDLLSTFSGVFSADNAQQGMSLLAGREGEQIAASCVTLRDDPLLKDGFASCPFDAEGVATYSKDVLSGGKLTTLLHNLKTARKAGVKTTGNASKAGYAAPVRVAPSNFFFVPGEKSLDALLADMGNGIVITQVSGLHAGANPISGDFSLIAKGCLVKDGKKASAVDQITVSGNFYQLLKNIRSVGSDLTFLGRVGSPSIDVGEISVAGK